MENKSITKYNELIESSYRLSLTESRIIFYCISLINPLSRDFEADYRIDIKNFSNMFSIAGNGIYSLLKEVVLNKFWEREFTLPTEKNRNLRIRWLIAVEYGDNEGYLKISINPKLKPYLHQLQRHFTTYYIDNIAKFKNMYSVRFYEFAIMELNKIKKNTCQFTIEIMEIKERLELQDNYSRFCDFKSRILEPACKEINQHSDIQLSHTVTKQGRTPHAITFTVYRKTEQAALPNLNRPPSNKLTPIDIDDAKEIIRKSGNRWDVYAIEEQFYEYIEKKGQPDKFKQAWRGFVQKKVKKCP